MKKLVLVFVAALALGGCNVSGVGGNWGALTAGVSAVVNFQVTQQQVDTARAAYIGGFLTPAKAYVSLPRCAAGTSFSFRNQCSEPDKVRQIQAITRTMQTNFAKVQALVDQGAQGSGVQSAWALLTSGIDAGKAIVASFTQG